MVYLVRARIRHGRPGPPWSDHTPPRRLRPHGRRGSRKIESFGARLPYAVPGPADGSLLCRFTVSLLGFQGFPRATQVFSFTDLQELSAGVSGMFRIAFGLPVI